MKKIFVCFLLISTFGYSQKEDIILPESTIKLDFIRTSPHYSIYITNNEELYFEDKRLRFWDEIGTNILKRERVPISKAVNDIIIYADKSVPYLFVQRTKDEIGKVWDGYIHYKGSTFENASANTFFISGSYLRNRRKKRYDDSISNLDIIYTTKEKIGIDKVPKLTDQAWPIIPAIWQHNFSVDFFKADTVFIKKALNEIKWSSLVIISDKSYSFKGKQYDFSDELMLKNIIKSNDLLFVKANFISYDKYFKAISFIQKQRFYAPKSPHGVLKKPFIIDIHYILEEDLMKKNIRLFD